MSKETKVTTLDELNLFIYKYYDTYKDLVYKVVSKFFNVTVFRFGNESKEDLIEKVTNFYKQLETKPAHFEHPPFLTYEITETFDIKTLFKK